MATKKWKCKVCGYIYEGENPPTNCPLCHADASEFELISGGKKMDTNSNSYTIMYAVVLVAIVAIVLSIAATALKPAQKANQETEKKEYILRTVGKVDKDFSGNKNTYIADQYKKYITEAFLVDVNGNRKNGDAFTTDLKQELRKPSAERSLPVFVCTDDSGSKRYIFPLSGNGLWGAIWGYIAFESNLKTIVGAVFDHASETPGLGAEITSAKFQNQFAGKTTYDESGNLKFIIRKPSLDPVSNNYTIDGISGGTLTSGGVQRMINTDLGDYQGFINKTLSENK